MRRHPWPVITGLCLLTLGTGAAPERAREEAAPAPAVAVPPPAGSAPAQAGPASPSAPARSGQVEIGITVDRRNVSIGDPVAIAIRLVHPADVRVTSFDTERPLAGMALLDRRSGEPEKLPDGRLQETHLLRVARYEVGQTQIPSFEATFVDAGGKEGKVATEPVPISVTTILAQGDSRPADIKSPAVMPERPLWPWLSAAAVVAAVIAFWLLRRRRARPIEGVAAAPTGPPRPAHETAYAELERLLSSGLLDKGQVKRFYIELAEILKRYFAARFGVDTFERTTSEILEALRLVRLPVHALTATADFFAACDMVKFAKYVPAPDETRATVERAYRLIDETKVREAPVPSVESAVAGAAR